ncbi:MAG TPA: hypothetical protein VFF63_02705 [Candidatus Babeliales bacterium]|nr:hypothetical protein [Candidatus Babeliales bacterium]
MNRLPLGLLATTCAALVLGAAPAAPPPQPGDAHAVIEHMEARNPSLRSYRTRVHVDIRMLSFPWLAPKLDGTSYYQRPNYYEVVFDRVPGYARGFQRLFDDIGNPNAWEKNQIVTLGGTTSLDGRPAIVLRMTKKIHSDILDHTLVYIDASDYALLQMEWYYTSGGKITMTQQFRMQGVYAVLSQQHADISIPHVRAVADASYGTYETNVPVATGSAAP